MFGRGYPLIILFSCGNKIFDFNRMFRATHLQWWIEAVGQDTIAQFLEHLPGKVVNLVQPRSTQTFYLTGHQNEYQQRWGQVKDHWPSRGNGWDISSTYIYPSGSSLWKRCLQVANIYGWRLYLTVRWIAICFDRSEPIHHLVLEYWKTSIKIHEHSIDWWRVDLSRVLTA